MEYTEHMKRLFLATSGILEGNVFTLNEKHSAKQGDPIKVTDGREETSGFVSKIISDNIIEIKFSGTIELNRKCSIIIDYSSRSGKTTRIVDRCIQEFFTAGVTYVYEGRDEEIKKMRNDYVFRIFCKRLESEHQGVKYNFIYGIFDGISCYKVEQHNL
ncbi:hypothetical protein [Flavobacterium sp.]|uniref:hypothetical protein n=1 Tax=Flavobacterium sp. TaxID=239 RepID=UPI003D6C5F45